MTTTSSFPNMRRLLLNAENRVSGGREKSCVARYDEKNRQIHINRFNLHVFTHPAAVFANRWSVRKRHEVCVIDKHNDCSENDRNTKAVNAEEFESILIAAMTSQTVPAKSAVKSFNCANKNKPKCRPDVISHDTQPEEANHCADVSDTPS